jgi:hypothetical protein
MKKVVPAKTNAAANNLRKSKEKSSHALPQVARIFPP